MANAAPTFPSTKETNNYARLCRLLVDVGSHVLRETFDKKRPPGTLDTVLSSPAVHHVLQSLRSKKVLKPSQWGKLYPTIKSSVSSQHFDITLLTVLLRNICGLVPPATGWDKLPPVADTTLEADIVRIKCYRNAVYGHASEASVDDAKFNQYWKDIQDALVRLGGGLYQGSIDELRKSSSDPDYEKHYQDLLKQWVMDEFSIKERLDQFEGKLDDFKESVINPGRRASGEMEVKEMKKKKDINILILGETGVGKSTWINGIANYVKHSSLKAAMDDREFTMLIPFRFTFTNEEGEGIDISFGSDANEDHTTGQSATQLPRKYTFETDTARFNLIDTPGIGDCRGIDRDKENFENILAFLTSYDKISAVVVLLKSNNSRLTVAFRFCVLELLTHLHRSLVSNIIFAFTNCRATFYRPGDTLPVLKKLLDERKIGINLSPSNYFCFDNEAFRFLACYKKSIYFTDEDVALYAKSWNKSRDTTKELLQRVIKIKPHETEKTLSLNNARNYIIALSKPMGEAVGLIGINLKAINDEKEKCRAFDADIKGFQAHLKFKGFSLKIEQLDYPMTVCAHEDCKEYAYVGERRERHTVYVRTCHGHCYLDGIPVQTTNNEQLFHCAAMSDGNCKECFHSYGDHMHITYKTILEEKEFLSKETQKIIMAKKDGKSRKEKFIEVLKEKIKELEDEKEYIYECASHFGIFLKENALIPYNDSFGEYIDMLIREEAAKEKEIRSDKKIKKMKEEKQTYEEKKKVILKNIASGSKGKNKPLPIDEIYGRKEKLCSLKHNGKTLEEALDGVMSARRRMHERKSCVPVKTDLKSWMEFFSRPFR